MMNLIIINEKAFNLIEVTFVQNLYLLTLFKSGYVNITYSFTRWIFTHNQKATYININYTNMQTLEMYLHNSFSLSLSFTHNDQH